MTFTDLCQPLRMTARASQTGWIVRVTTKRLAAGRPPSKSTTLRSLMLPTPSRLFEGLWGPDTMLRQLGVAFRDRLARRPSPRSLVHNAVL